MNRYGHNQYHTPQQAMTTSVRHPYAGTTQPQGGSPITKPTNWDVLNGRGQGIQRLPGNVKYRSLVFANKGLYAKCHNSDKLKISKGIVAAVRELGGRFLKLNERTGIYEDIGDKKATEKTSQALREGQTEIRKEMYEKGEMTPSPEKSADAYFAYSVQVLESLYNAGTRRSNAPTHDFQQVVPSPVTSTSIIGTADADTCAMAKAIDQFPAYDPSAKEWSQTQPNSSFDSSEHDTIEPIRPSLPNLLSLRDMSISSVGQLLESARTEDIRPSQGVDRRSALSQEIRALIRQSEPQLLLAEGMAMDEIITHEDLELFLSDEDSSEDRVSEMDMRFTDLTMDCGSFRDPFQD